MTTEKDRIEQGVALYMLLDRSGSMGETVNYSYQGSGWNKETKFTKLKQLTAKLIEQLPHALIGVIAFARTPEVLSPLTLDHQALLTKLSSLEVVRNPEEDGTAMGYALYKAAHLIETLRKNSGYPIKDAFLLVITDGLQDPHPEDGGDRLRAMSLQEAANFVKKVGAHADVISIDPKINSSQLAPNKKELETAVNYTGGQLIVTENIDQLEGLFDQVQKAVESKIRVTEAPLLYQLFYPYFVVTGLFCMAIGFVLEEGWLRRFP